MSNSKVQAFDGLHREGIGFLEVLKFQNEPAFFNANKEIYLNHIKQPLVALNDELASTIKNIDDTLDVRAKRALCRIRKDARYSKGVPYRTNMWMAYKPSDRSNTNYFTYFFYHDTVYYEVGIGFYGAHREMMQNFRDRIEANPDLFKKVIKAIDMNELSLEGEDYLRPPKKVSLGKELEKWYNKKSFYVYKKNKLDETAFSSDLVPQIKEIFVQLVPLYDFVLGRTVRFNFNNC